MNKLKMIYRLSDIKYLWVLLFSMTAFVASLCIHSHYRDINLKSEIAMYAFGVAVALIWSLLNYMSHLKLNALYKRYDDINVFVAHMTMPNDEKVELVQYLNDFVKDLEEKGETHEAAVRKAISHFQVQEFLELKGGDIFEKPTHYYLLGFSSIFLGVFLLLAFLSTIIRLPFIVSAASFALALYSFGFFGLFFLYKLIDVLIVKK